MITEFPVPTSSGTLEQIVTGPDGNLWFTDFSGQTIWRMTTAGVTTPFATGGNPEGITAGPDGNLWFTQRSGNKIARITLSGVITEFQVPTPNCQPYGITAGPDGNIWFTEVEDTVHQIGRMTLAGVFTEFLIPTASSAPYAIVPGPDGNLWFTESAPLANQIGRITLAGDITEFPIPTAGGAPVEITAGPDGNMWFTEHNGNNIGRITLSGVITEFPVPTASSQPWSIRTGPDGNLWFTEISANQIAKAIIPIFDIVSPVTSNVSIAPSPLAVNTASSLTASISDAMTGGSNIASAYYTIDGGSSFPMLLTPSVAVTTQASATLLPFSQSNVYNVCVYGADSAGNTGANTCILLPVYDPSGGFVTGGGQVASPAGADLLNTSAAGQATFGFVSKYLPGRNIPSGNLEFQFKNGNLNFKSTSMDWLVVTGQPRAKFHGIGTVNGTYTCNFEVDAWAGSFTGNVDAFGLKITSCSNGGDRYNLPATALTKGSIIIHK
ncbi:MAG: hypothetical protein HYX25_09680 [Candidatus Solibacter usitatus]|nr:hypothetical protein [Candidatus Solibacter usitatus]